MKIGNRKPGLGLMKDNEMVYDLEGTKSCQRPELSGVVHTPVTLSVFPEFQDFAPPEGAPPRRAPGLYKTEQLVYYYIQAACAVDR